MGLLAVARSITALGREHFLPPVAAWVHHKTQTPIITTAVLGVVTGDDSSAAAAADLWFHAALQVIMSLWRFCAGLFILPIHCHTEV